MYVIKKNAGSISNPLLVNCVRFGGLMYGKLEQTFTHPDIKLMTFPSVSEARTFIADHPGVCDEHNVICEAKFSLDSMSLTFEPIPN